MPRKTDRLRLPTVASLPSGAEGDVFGQTSDHRLYVHNGTAFVAVTAKARRFERTFDIMGSVPASTNPLAGFFIPESADESISLVACRYKILSGTSIAFRLQNNGSDITGFGTSGTPLSATTTATTTNPTDVPIAADDLITLVTGAAVSSPSDLILSLYFESVA